MKREALKAVARSPNWIGDAVMALPALLALKREMELWVAGKSWIEELYADAGFAGFITFNSKVQLISGLRGKGFELGILFPNSFSSALLMRLAGVKRLAGYPSDMRGWLLEIKVSPPGKKLHQVDLYRRIAEALVGEANLPLKLPLSPERRERGKELLAKAGFVREAPVVGINPGAFYGSAKCWPAERFRQLVRKLRSRGFQVAVFGSPSEKQLSEFVAGRDGVSFAGWTSVGDLVSILANITLLVTNDSGPMHIANALGVPVVALFGPTDPELTGPYNKPHILIYKNPPCGPCWKRTCPPEKHICMNSIQVEEVEEAVLRLLDGLEG